MFTHLRTNTVSICVCLITVPNKAAHVPPSVPTVAGGYSKIQVTISDLPKAAKNQSVLRLHFRSLLRQVSSVELFGDTAIITLETPIS